jgi:hypothetical protein
VRYATTKRNTTLRTVRLTRDLDNLLQKDAKAKRMSVNSLMTAMITKYAEWDRHAEKFGFVSLTRDGLRLILEAVDDNKLSQIGKHHGETTNKEFLMFWFKKINIHIFLDGLSLFCKYARVAEYDLETDGKNYTITMHHELGEKWSNWLGHVISQGIETDLGLNPKLDFSKSSIIIKFLVP